MFFGSLLLWGRRSSASRASRSSGPPPTSRILFFFVGFVLIDILTCMVASPSSARKTDAALPRPAAALFTIAN